MTAADLEKLGKQIAEAQALLTKRGEIEHEIAKGRKQLDRLLEDIAKAEARLEITKLDCAASEERLTHERRRYDLDLKAHVDNVNVLKAAAEKDLVDCEREIARQRTTLEAEYAAAAQTFEREIADLATQRDALRKIIGQAKQQLTALG